MEELLGLGLPVENISLRADLPTAMGSLRFGGSVVDEFALGDALILVEGAAIGTGTASRGVAPAASEDCNVNGRFSRGASAEKLATAFEPSSDSLETELGVA